MSETINNIPLTPITVPELNSSEYANGISNAFDAINDNFELLANHDFVKGDRGNSVQIVNTSFFDYNDVTDEYELNLLGKKLKHCILADNNENDRADIGYDGGVLNLFDNFTGETAGSIPLIYNSVNEDDEATPISSLYYIFLDGRYANNVIGSIDASLYNNVKDLSCILVYDGEATVTLKENDNGNEVDVEYTGAFRKLNNAFPTVYYERGVGLCWKINGNNSGVPIQGIPGRNGLNTPLNIVKCDTPQVVNNLITCNVMGIYNTPDGYVEINNIDIDDIEMYDNTPALILVPKNNSNNVTNGGDETGNSCNFYFGCTKLNKTINENGDETLTLIAECNTENSINYELGVNDIINAMKNINIFSNAASQLKGLFLPMNVQNNGKQPVHLLTSISNNVSESSNQTNGVRNNVIFTPVKDINTLGNNGQLVVDRYLYIKIQKEYTSMFVSNVNKVTSSDVDKNNCILKYKLNQVQTDFTLIDEITKNNDYYGIGIYDNANGTNNVVNLTPHNVAVYKVSNYTDGILGDADKTTSIRESLPKEFYDRLDGDNSKGLYEWVLCNDVDSFDIDELPSADINKGNYNFPKVFKYVFTDTISPSANTRFIWFNALENITSDYYDFTSASGSSTNTDGSGSYYLIPGWNVDKNVFKFVKLTPVFSNAFIENVDASLNLQYDVTIGGNTNDHTNSLTVNGNVNCDNLNVYKLTATGEIKDIFTKDNIIGESGIYLGKDIDADKYNCIIDAGGNITTKGNVSLSSLSGKTIIGDEINSRQCISSELFVNDSGNDNRMLYVGGVVTNFPSFMGGAKNSSNIELYDVSKLTIKPYDVSDIVNKSNISYNYNPDLPVIDNTVSTIQHGNSNIIVSNEFIDENNLCCYGTRIQTRDSKIHNGVTASSDNLPFIHNTDFDYVKNFNMHTMAIAGKKYQTFYVSNNNTINNIFKTTGKDISINSIFTDSGIASDYIIARAGGNTKVANITATTPDNANNKIVEFSLFKDSQENKLTNFKISGTEPIRIEFNCNFISKIGCKSKVHYGANAVMFDSSNMKLDTYYIITKKDNTVDGPYKISDQTKTLEFDYAVNTLKHGGTQNMWKGYNAIGNVSYANDYDLKWRFYDFVFRPTDIVISPNSADFKNIKNAYDNGELVTIYVTASYKLDFKSQYGSANKQQKQVIADCAASIPVPIEVGYNPVNTLRDKVNIMFKTYNNKKETPCSIANTHVTLKYTNSYERAIQDDDTGDTDTLKSTTICKDGFVTRAGDYVFGLGYARQFVNHTHENIGYSTLKTQTLSPGDSDNPTWTPKTGNMLDYNRNMFKTNEPVLFYHKYDPHYYDENGNPEQIGLLYNLTNTAGYSQRINVIPLTELFDMLRFYNENKQSLMELLGKSK